MNLKFVVCKSGDSNKLQGTVNAKFVLLLARSYVSMYLCMYVCKWQGEGNNKVNVSMCVHSLTPTSSVPLHVYRTYTL